MTDVHQNLGSLNFPFPIPYSPFPVSRFSINIRVQVTHTQACLNVFSARSKTKEKLMLRISALDR